jgi:hypothetical protein
MAATLVGRRANNAALNAAIECQYLGFQCHQLVAQRGKACARHFRDPGVIDVSNDFQQLFDAVASNRRYDPELCKAGADRVDNCRLLALVPRTGAKVEQFYRQSQAF